MIWCCPIHHGTLIPEASQLRAECCGQEFPVVDGIPDLRIGRPAWIDFAADRHAASTLAHTVPAGDVAGSIHAVFARRAGWSAARIAHRTTLTLALSDKLRTEWQGWLATAAAHPGPLLDVGCGAGSLLAVAPTGGVRIGVDVSMEWLVVAQRLCRVGGVEAHFAAALAEALPLRDGTIGIVTALDVIEHVDDQGAMVREMDRVLQPGGSFCGATPNRYSVSAEPHVGVWGVGWLPRSLQARYVRWRSGLPYAFTRLLSHQELIRLFRENATFVPGVEPAPIPTEDQRLFDRRRQLLARWYNALLRVPPFRYAAGHFGAFFHLLGTKPGIATGLTLGISVLQVAAPG